MSHVTIYTSDGCTYCTRLKDWLQQHGITYDEKNVSQNKDYFDELHARGIYTSPVVIIGDQSVVGFRPNKMKEILGI